MDADGVTFACATTAELRAARRAGAHAALVGLGAANGVPDGPVVSFGLAGALRDDLPSGTVLDATRVVDEDGAVLWEGEPLGVAGAKPATILAADEVVDDPAERRRLHERTGADAADLESGPLARTGRLRGVLRAVSDTPVRTLHGISASVTPAVGENCERRGLVVVDAVCPLVSKVHAEARRYADSGHLVALVGHADHVEVIGTRGERPDSTIVVESPEDAEKLETNGKPVAVITQTTLSLDDVRGTVEA